MEKNRLKTNISRYKSKEKKLEQMLAMIKNDRDNYTSNAESTVLEKLADVRKSIIDSERDREELEKADQLDDSFVSQL